MAPKRGGSSGGSSGSSVSSCPGAFNTTREVVYLASDAVLLAVLLGVTIALCTGRKKSSVTGKKLISLPYIGALLFLFMSVFLEFYRGSWC
jgi:hypothetical protein